jgi:hypothetical protein
MLVGAAIWITGCIIWFAFFNGILYGFLAFTFWDLKIWDISTWWKTFRAFLFLFECALMFVWIKAKEDI